MKQQKHELLHKLVGLAIASAFALILTACGGGGGSAGTTSGGTGGGTISDGVDTNAGSIMLALRDTSGLVSNRIDAGHPLNVIALIKDAEGNAAQNVIVTFAVPISGSLVDMSQTTALTDTYGKAQITLMSANAGSGAGQVTASVTGVGSTTLTAYQNFSVSPPTNATPASIESSSVSPTNKSIVIKGSGGLTRSEVALLIFKVMDSAGNGVPDVLVNFAKSGVPVTLSATSGTTDSEGRVYLNVNSNTTPGTATITATVNNTAISTQVSGISVVTGQAVQTAFSLSMETHNPEGWDIDNITVPVQILLADENGDAVTDGWQVVFTTNAGAIFGPNGDAKCDTTNGACSVTWRSQNPRLHVGTIVATATNGNATLSTSQQFFMSGSYGLVWLGDGKLPEVFTAVNVDDGESISMSFASSCDPKKMNIQVTDESGLSPMPKGTKISVAGATNATVTILPDEIGDMKVGSNKVVHRVDVTPTNCNTTGTKTVKGWFYIMVESPGGTKTYTLVDMGTFNAN